MSHISSVESTMVGFFGVAISLLVFPLALYSPESPHLLTLASLGYVSSWGFILAVVAGICLRIRAFSNNATVTYPRGMEILSGGKLHTNLSMVIAMLSTFLLMAVPWIYVGFLPPPVGAVPLLSWSGLAGDVAGVIQFMFFIYVIFVIMTVVAAFDAMRYQKQTGVGSNASVIRSSTTTGS